MSLHPRLSERPPTRTTAPPSRRRPARVRRWSSRPAAFTLLELTVVLGLISLVIGLGAPLWREAADAWAVRVARDRTAVALHRTRVEARRWGGARLELDAERGLLRLFLTSNDSLAWEDASLEDLRVQLVLPRDAPATTLSFDPLGLGIVASRTLVFRRGRAERRLVVSSRGRGTRR